MNEKLEDIRNHIERLEPDVLCLIPGMKIIDLVIQFFLYQIYFDISFWHEKDSHKTILKVLIIALI